MSSAVVNATPLFVVALALGAPALKDPPKKATDIVGEWVLESMLVGGQAESVDKDTRWTFNADGTRAIRHDGRLVVDASYVVNVMTNPATLDLNPGAPGHCRYLCVYKVTGNRLTVNVGWATADRPTDFECDAGFKCSLYVFKRAKAKD